MVVYRTETAPVSLCTLASVCSSLQGADGMERATKVKAVVFDKTGTLTVGKPTVLEHRLFDPQVCWSLIRKQQTSMQWDVQIAARVLCRAEALTLTAAGRCVAEVAFVRLSAGLHKPIVKKFVSTPCRPACRRFWR